MAARVPFAKADTSAVCRAADYALEQAGHLLPLLGDTTTAVPVGYLRRVPEWVEPILKAAWPFTVVKWETTFMVAGQIRRLGLPRMPQTRTVINSHVAYPLCLLEPLLEFLRPSGRCHLAKLDTPLALDPEAVVNLSHRRGLAKQTQGANDANGEAQPEQGD